jgi:predicted nucleic acid-binding protein
MKDNILIDSNVLIYAETTDDEQKHATAISAMEKAKLDYVPFISIQNLNELCSNLVKKSKLGYDSINDRISSHKDSFELVSFSVETIKTATQLAREHKVHFYDCLLAATMRENKIFAIITENEDDFKRIPGIKVINPFKEAK